MEERYGIRERDRKGIGKIRKGDQEKIKGHEKRIWIKAWNKWRGICILEFRKFRNRRQGRYQKQTERRRSQKIKI